MACIHGNDPRTCIVCQTLAEVDTLREGKATGSRRAPTSAPVEVMRPGEPTPSTQTGHRFGFHAAVFMLVLFAAAISVWFAAGIIFAAIRVAEVLLVAIVAATLGYRVGRAKGRRERR